MTFRLMLLALAITSQPLFAQSERTTIMRLTGDISGGQHGHTVINAGDLNQDGVTDLLVSAVYENRVYAYSGATGQTLYVLAPSDLSSGGDFGHELESLGDLNQDGVPDFAIGEPYYNTPLCPRAGRVSVRSGVDGSVIQEWTGEGIVTGLGEYSYYGYTILNAGDLDQDGVADILIGAPYADNAWGGTNIGYIEARSGKTGAFLYNINGGETNDHFGFKMAALPDVDGDGAPDFIYSCSHAFKNGLNANGFVRAFSGRTGQTLYDIAGDYSWKYFGVSISSCLDFDGDGLRDFITSAPGPPPVRGAYSIFSSADGSLLLEFEGEFDYANAGTSISPLPDANNDGVEDILIGCRQARISTSQRNVGYVFIASGVDGTPIRTYWGRFENEFLGCSVASLGDINQDGHPDFVAGAHGRDDVNVTTWNGNARVFSSQPLPFSQIIPPAYAGSTFECRAMGAFSFANLYLCYSLTGSGPTPWGTGGLIFDLSMPIGARSPRTSELEGDAFWPPVLVPPSLSPGTQVWVQILSLRGTHHQELSLMTPIVVQ